MDFQRLSEASDGWRDNYDGADAFPPEPMPLTPADGFWLCVLSAGCVVVFIVACWHWFA